MRWFKLNKKVLEHMLYILVILYIVISVLIIKKVFLITKGSNREDKIALRSGVLALFYSPGIIPMGYIVLPSTPIISLLGMVYLLNDLTLKMFFGIIFFIFIPYLLFWLFYLLCCYIFLWLNRKIALIHF